jgi:hypothetical protein
MQSACCGAPPSQEGRDGRGRQTKEEIMRLNSQGELLRATKLELNVLLRRIAAELPNPPEGSHERPIAHYNMHNIRVALRREESRLRREYARPYLQAALSRAPCTFGGDGFCFAGSSNPSAIV